MKAKGTFTVKKWEEKDAEIISPEMKTTKAVVEYAFEGDAQGVASIDYLMFYKYFDPNDPHKASAIFVGLLQFSGKLLGKTGSFFVRENGVFENGLASSTYEIIAGSGLGELKQISGTGHYLADQDGSHFEFDYNL
jgi:Protein of unknown function (DUF3224)